ncbi:MAG: aldo/keto reductase [Propionibacteriaceae bacterium]|jgi:predicted oxidoreductase|nr:aldo/keto reductase [Propionibacteriaceae bacterium]
MKTFTLSQTDLTVPAVVAGMMRIAELDDAAIRTLVNTALDAGINFFDHADIYGGQLHRCEERFAAALHLTSSQRQEMIIQSKCGIARDGQFGYFDFSYDHIVSSVNASLTALQTDYLDILLLHRPDALVEPDEVARAFDDLAAAGKVRYFGVSNHTPGQIELLQSKLGRPLVANQVQLSITHSPMIAQGIAMNMAGEDQSISRDSGLIDYCRLRGITLQAWSPFQAGFFDGVFLDNPAYAALNASLDRIAQRYDVTPMSIATAWITRHPADIQVILGTTNPDRVRQAAAGADIVLTRPEWYELFRTAGHIIP